MKIIILKGLPGSGKTTWAKEYQKKHPDTKRVNKDELRAMIDDGKWSRENEKEVIGIRDGLVCRWIARDLDIIVDDTNFAPEHEKSLREIAKEGGYEVEVKLVDTPLAECIARDAKRPKPVGEKVIRDMHNKYLKTAPETAPYNPSLPDAIICDIDGTLAHMVNRSPFDWHRVGEDGLDENVAAILSASATFMGCKVLLVSGRDEVCFRETEDWLKKYSIYHDRLFMRAPGDNRKDTIIKQEILDREIRGKYNIAFVLDDRDQVVQMWRENGLKCLQVAEGAF